MSNPYPDWDTADPVASMRRTAEWFVEEARTTFLTDGTHVELFFLFKDDGSYSMGPRPPDMPKDQFMAVLRQRIRDDNTLGVVHILEAWVYIPRKPNDHTMKQILAGEMGVGEMAEGRFTRLF